MIEVAPPAAASPDGDPLAVLVGFAATLREDGFAVSTDRIAVAAGSLGHWRATGDANPYWPLRISLCSSETDVWRFDAAYRRWFVDPRAGDPADQGALATAPRAGAAGRNGPAGTAPEDTDSGAGNATDLSTHDFGDLTDEQMREVSAWIELLGPVPRRRAMHRRPARSGGIDPSRTMRRMLGDNGELLRLRYRRHAARPRSVLLLVDVSASMRPYSDALLQLGHATLRANPDTAEVFAIGTRFTHLSAALRTRRPDLALRAAGNVRTDWARGTTLGVALQDFLRRWGGSRAVRSATVVLGSDGLEFHDPALLIAQAGRLAALAHAFIWADPAHRDADDRPVDDQVARAQAHATTVAGCHSYQAIRELAKVISNA
ncbi:vWA domain-containing protein [Jatrophihabitans sp.]|jgi:hypothetical protein|uniref:vWA domain-containing protein n=1 Tax=Jatrophihabitans sp. TaxID=1932789 RepID=UPI002F1F4970